MATLAGLAPEVWASDISTIMAKMTQRGFITLPLLGWAAIGAGVVIVGLSVALKVQGARLEAANERLEAIKLAGEIAQKEADRVAKADKERKDKSDAENKRSITMLRRDNERLRQSANSSSLPAPSTDSGSPDRIAFDRAELDAAIRGFTAGVSDVITKGAEAVVNLDTAKKWAQSKP